MDSDLIHGKSQIVKLVPVIQIPKCLISVIDRILKEE